MSLSGCDMHVRLQFKENRVTNKIVGWQDHTHTPPSYATPRLACAQFLCCSFRSPQPHPLQQDPRPSDRQCAVTFGHSRHLLRIPDRLNAACCETSRAGGSFDCSSEQRVCVCDALPPLAALFCGGRCPRQVLAADAVAFCLFSSTPQHNPLHLPPLAN